MKDEVRTIPMWIKLPGLDLKYWGAKALTKICGGVGKFIKPDNSTLNKDKLQYALVLIETELDGPLPDSITFINEKGCTITQVVQYDWKPILCNLCKRFGHEGKSCKRGATVTKWVPKVKQTQAMTQTQQQSQHATQHQNDKQQEDEDFTAIKRKTSSPQRLTCAATDGILSVNNKFHMLSGVNSMEPETLDGKSMPFEISIWNVRGLNDLDKRRKVKEFISYHKIQLFSLLETRVKRANLGNIYLSLCPDWNLISNHAHHYNGRIIVAWNPHVFTIDVLGMTDQLIHTEILVNATNMKFLCTFVYGHNDVQKRNCLWNFLSDTAATHSKPWCVGGDFNAIMHFDDRTGSVVREKDIRPMANCMLQCSLHDVKSIGRFYTWNNKQDGCNRILSKIDRFLCNQTWETTFQEAIVHFCPEGEFDHTPMVITTVKAHHGLKPFKFYNHWVTHELLKIQSSTPGILLVRALECLKLFRN
ncbi:uncharacterized protein LOC130810791 [Amaranthus tricolor]|uniref:uncharacterized protein LOC130810791 n=1 Tax=Amaranthus tricolor TaxID=29722 RepID=UPI00258C00C4|nr:uncharacterized protein LOC130810791 [Amaranthus tricolor]